MPKGERPKLQDIHLTAEDLNAIVQLSVHSLSKKAVLYPDTQEGFVLFKTNCINYFRYLDNINEPKENEHKLVPDIEGLCLYLSISRQTLLKYEHSRSEEWQSFIGRVKTAILAAKKQLAFRQKIPTVLFIFDTVNNADYVNVSEFKLAPVIPEERGALTAADLPKLGTISTTAELPILEHNGDNI